MNKTLNMALKLLVICAAAAFALGVVNAFTAPEIKKLEDEAKAKALSDLVESGYADPNKEVIVQDNSTVSSYYLIEKDIETIGYILYLKAKGYGGMMTVMASYKLDGSLIGSVLMENSETPGFGKKAEKPDYMRKFIGRGGRDNPIPLFSYQVEEEVDTVSGATITFMGVSSALKNGSDFVKGGLK
ncbi:FMN-binding protein [Thiospirochaeta perfilievii]|uniref:Ion-translocating oxidoreductase complex subunit G n=1 Tax=Thiospirochaeta perfilievii TaxID=252967 RepID=A0A5C1QAW9_9SPIO|nr:FMN-binding protein [Thiospirochaeta perfilievii]QEN03804.1 FMN-binding protein [Thiospirochaeta perfilievii]